MFATVFTVALFGISPCRSATIYDTTPPATSLDFDVSPTVKQATMFHTTASDFVVTSMAFDFRKDSEDPATGFLNWLIYTDNSGLPGLPIAGNPIYNMNVAGLTTSYSTVSTGALNVSLSPSTTYWLVFNGESLSSGVLQLLESVGPSGVGGPFKAASYQSSGPWSGNSAVAPSGVITAVPEPSTCAMALAGLACGGYSMWRRRKRA
ncbi:MAG: PEP-CTERM sorting domain-containing protein [Planctomycetia bacterium]|nr:PEP-CTERM sorting domain-containing protein [Planctomycetia bacterium]